MYGWMGTGCNCGGPGPFDAYPWQANTGTSLGPGQGFYSGGVNQFLFKGSLPDGEHPNCGQTCGGCYELMTTGTNAYAGGARDGSTITMMVVDSCYNNHGAPNWCSSNGGDGTDDFGCLAHFDVQTSPPLPEGVEAPAAFGKDGVEWTRELSVFSLGNEGWRCELGC